MINLHFHWAWLLIIVILIIAKIISHRVSDGGDYIGFGGFVSLIVWIVAILICAVIGGIWIW